jgi:para-aminobenzoate synthetase component 1
MVSSFFMPLSYFYVMLHTSTIKILKPEKFRKQLMQWLDFNFPFFIFQEGNGFEYPQGTFPNQAHASSTCIDLQKADLLYRKSDLAGIISYDYKNKVENLQSINSEVIALEETVFFQPELSIQIEKDFLVFKGANAEDFVISFQKFTPSSRQNPRVRTKRLTTLEDYIQKVKNIQNHIREGDMYELNYCMGFSFEGDWDPILAYEDLMQISPMPFSGVFKSKSKYLLAASPERFLKRKKSKMIAQPIKGTIKRGTHKQEDDVLKEQLFNSEKERAENLMIVDLMRNDLSKISKTGSVEVDELFGIYSFPRVHQMISTVSSDLKEGPGLKEIIHATFPMGSMTGAPKVKCMELIDDFENFKRGWFSGCFGFFQENGDFDLNVIIRSILFDKEKSKGYFAVGSAITFDADPEYEYAECLLKASAILQILEG